MLLCICSAVVLFLSVAPITVGATSFDENVVVNAGCESGNATQAWTVLAGPPICRADDLTGKAGTWFFSGGTAPIAIIRQRVNVTDLAASIDQFQAKFFAFGYFGGFAARRDLASMAVSCLDANDVLLGRTLTIGSVTETERARQSKLLFRRGEDCVPKNTRTVQIVLTLIRDSPPNNEAAADDLRVQLRNEPCRIVTRTATTSPTESPSSTRTNPMSSTLSRLSTPTRTVAEQPRLSVSPSFGGAAATRTASAEDWVKRRTHSVATIDPGSTAPSTATGSPNITSTDAQQTTTAPAPATTTTAPPSTTNTAPQTAPPPTPLPVPTLPPCPTIALETLPAPLTESAFRNFSLSPLAIVMTISDGVWRWSNSTWDFITFAAHQSGEERTAAVKEGGFIAQIWPLIENRSAAWSVPSSSSSSSSSSRKTVVVSLPHLEDFNLRGRNERVTVRFFPSAFENGGAVCAEGLPRLVPATYFEVIADQSATKTEIEDVDIVAVTAASLGAAVGLLGFSGGSSAVDAQAFAVLSGMACASRREQEAGRTARYAVSFFVALGPEAVVLGNIGIAVFVFVAQLALVWIDSRRLHHTFSDASARFRFPSVALAVVFFMYQGIAISSLQILIDPRDAVFIPVGVLGVFTALAVPALSIFAFKTRVNATYVEQDRDGIIAIILKPYGRWFSEDECRRHGTLFKGVKSGYHLWSLLSLATSACVAMVSVWKPADDSGCAAQLGMLAGVFLMAAVAVAVVRPHRSLFLTVAHITSMTLLGAMATARMAHKIAPESTEIEAVIEALGMAAMGLSILRAVYDLALYLWEKLIQKPSDVKRRGGDSTALQDPLSPGTGLGETQKNDNNWVSSRSSKQDIADSLVDSMLLPIAGDEGGKSFDVRHTATQRPRWNGGSARSPSVAEQQPVGPLDRAQNSLLGGNLPDELELALGYHDAGYRLRRSPGRGWGHDGANGAHAQMRQEIDNALRHEFKPLAAFLPPPPPPPPPLPPPRMDRRQRNEGQWYMTLATGQYWQDDEDL